MGLDGHDVGVKVLAHALIDAGFDIVYTGLRKSIEHIVNMAIEQNVDVIGLSILSGTHLILAERMKELATKKSLDIPWIIGGNIPHQDIETLKDLGATAAFPTGTKINEVVEYFKGIELKSVWST